ncbi:MAG: type II secretion system F family protein [Gammaproteobacteria bacterium]
MPSYEYSAVDSSGKKMSGVLVVPDQEALRQHLTENGQWLLASKERKTRVARGASSGPKIKRRALIDFTMQLAILTRAGVPLSETLEQLEQDTLNPDFAKMIGALRFNVSTGVEFSQALEQFPRTFPQLYIELVRAGEISGNLPEILLDMQHYLEWSDSLASDARQATTYPAIIGIAIVLLVAVLFTFVVPQFTQLLTTMGVDLPAPTRVVMGISAIFSDYWHLILLVMVLVPTGIALGKRYSPGFAFNWERLLVALPVFGQLRLRLALSRFSHNLAILFRSGIPMVDCLKMLPALVGNLLVADAISRSAEEVAAGAGLAESFSRHRVFEPLVLRMLAVGESTGDMSGALEQAARYYEEAVPRTIKRFFGVLEPTLILFMVAIVGLVALAIFLPLLSLGASL